MKNIKIKIRKIKSDDYDWIRRVFRQRWGGEPIVTRGKAHWIRDLNGYLAEVKGKKVGIITYKIKGKELEIISLDSLLEGKGVGAKLVKKVISLVQREKLERIWLITTNDNLKAIGFWQKRGFVLATIYPNALKISRQIKPTIPLIGVGGIPLRDEIELEMKFENENGVNSIFNKPEVDMKRSKP